MKCTVTCELSCRLSSNVLCHVDVGGLLGVRDIYRLFPGPARILNLCVSVPSNQLRLAGQREELLIF